MVIAGALALAVVAALEGIAAHSASSAGVLADALHNAGDALTTLVLLGAFWLVARPANARYSHGYGRAEDLATALIVLVVGVSASAAAWFAVMRLASGGGYHNVMLAVGAALLSAGVNLGLGAWKLKVGKAVGSQALVADGVHGRADALAAAGAALGIGLAGMGLGAADPVVGLGIALGMVWLLRGTVSELYWRMMEAVEPALSARLGAAAASVAGVRGVHDVQARWVGRELHATMHIDCDPQLSLLEAHAVALAVEEAVCVEMSAARLEIHVDPGVEEARYHGHHHTGQHGPEGKGQVWGGQQGQ